MKTDYPSLYVPVRVMTLVDGDVSIARRLLRNFLDDLPHAWHAIEEAIASGRPNAIAQATHYLGGSLALVEGEALAERMSEWGRLALTGALITPSQMRAAHEALTELAARVRSFVEVPAVESEDEACR